MITDEIKERAKYHQNTLALIDRALDTNIDDDFRKELNLKRAHLAQVIKDLWSRYYMFNEGRVKLIGNYSIANTFLAEAKPDMMDNTEWDITDESKVTKED